MRLRTTLTLLGFLLLLAFAYSPLIQAGLLAPDLALLLDGRNAAGASTLAGLSLALSAALHLAPGDAIAAALEECAALPRLENLVLHVFAAVGLGLFTRRLLLPWSGSDQATAAAKATVLFYALHPLAAPSVASLAARGDLLALAFGTWSAAAFLRGRQDRRYALTGLALLLCVLAGASSEAALGVPFVLAVGELASAHRYRPLRVRLRTALTTLVVFGLGASVESILDLIGRGSQALPPPLLALSEIGSGAELLDGVVIGIEKLGFLVLPANPLALGTAGTVLAGALFLLAMQPALVAARSAPRLWGWLLVGWLLALAGSELLHAHVRVTGADFSMARALLPSAAVLSVGLGLGATALSGPGRSIVSWGVALGFACLSHGNVRPWREAATVTANLRQDLQAARERYGDGRLLVLDPPGPVQGIDPLGDALGRLLDPSDQGGDVLGLSVPAFLALLGEPEFDQLVAGPVVVVTSDSAFTSEGRRAVLLEPPRASSAVPPWQASLKSPQLDLEPLQTATLRVTVTSEEAVLGLSRVSWLSSESKLPDLDRSHAGTWVTLGAERVGVFDLGGSLAWRLGGRVRSLLFDAGTRPFERAEILTVPPDLGSGEPRLVGDDWVFVRPTTRLVEAAGSRGGFWLGVLDLTELTYEEIPARSVPDGLRFPDVGRLTDGGGPYAWLLDYRIDGQTLARSRGRLP